MIKRKFQIFVSSTFLDLVVERQAAVAAILKAGHIPAGMELFTAGDKSQLQTIKRWIDESDGYMLILGGRYGSIEPVSGISYTELEFDYAIEQQKPLFSIVIKDDALELKIRSSGSAMIEKNNPNALGLFRAKVLSNVSSFFSDEKDVRLAVHESLADLRDNPEARGWISAGDVEDTRPLHDEILRLREEIIQLNSKAENLQNRIIKSKNTDTDNIRSIIRTLMGIEVKVPPAISGTNDEVVTSLFDVFYSYKDFLINGVGNRFNASAFEQFLYFNIAPKLIVYDLVVNEKVIGVQYRRSFVSSLGILVLAQIEKIVKERKKLSYTDSKDTA